MAGSVGSAHTYTSSNGVSIHFLFYHGNDGIRSAPRFAIAHIFRHHPSLKVGPHPAHRRRAERRAAKHPSISHTLLHRRDAVVAIPLEHTRPDTKGHNDGLRSQVVCSFTSPPGGRSSIPSEGVGGSPSNWHSTASRSAR